MRTELLELIRCPACRHRLAVGVAQEDEIEWLAGNLLCASCGRRYGLDNGMPFLYLNDERWLTKAREANGWVQIHKNQGIYEQTSEVDLKIPYYPEEPWVRVAKSFDYARAKLNLDGSERILDLGAGRGWAAKHFALSGHEVVAVDVVPDSLIGLGRSRALMDAGGVYFERIIADGENLPFDKEIFDVVFCAAALHHFSDLPLLFKNICDVLKPGGRLCAINEPCISVAAREEQILQKGPREELDVGINETRPNIIQYVEALEGAGLEVTDVALMGTTDLKDAQLVDWKRQSCVAMPRVSLSHPFYTTRALGHFVLRRILAMRNGNFKTSRMMAERAYQLGLDVDGLLWLGGEIFMIATKPATAPSQRLLLK